MMNHSMFQILMQKNQRTGKCRLVMCFADKTVFCGRLLVVDVSPNLIVFRGRKLECVRYGQIFAGVRDCFNKNMNMSLPFVF